MKKYNLSNIMKRAWSLVKKESYTMSAALKKSWSEAKNPRSIVKMCVIRKETFVVNAQTGKVTGNTYHSRQFLKENFHAAWNTDNREWTVDVAKFNFELDNHMSYYKKYIVEESTSVLPASGKVIAYKELVNRNDGFYSYIQYKDGTHEYVFVG